MRFKHFALCAFTVMVPLLSQSETLAGGIWVQNVPEPIRELGGQTYLPSCQTLLSKTLTRQGVVEQLVESAATEHQVLQLLYDAGLILSATYAQAFEQASSILSQTIGSRAAGRRIEELMKRPPDELLHFAWQVLVTEPQFHDGSADTDWYYPPELIHRRAIRHTQILETLDALRHSPHPEAVEKALLAVTTQSLLSLSRAHLLARAEKWQKRSHGWRNSSPTVAATGLVIAGSIALDWEFAHILMAAHSNVPMAGLFFGGALAFAVNEYSLEQLRNMTSYVLANRKINRAKKVQRPVFILPKVSGTERMELANGLNDLEDHVSPAIPIAELCEASICNLNPIQLAYLGDLDFLQLKGEITAIFGASHSNLNPQTDATKKLIRRLDNLRRKFEFLRPFITPDSIRDGVQRQFLTEQINRNLDRLADLRLQLTTSDQVPQRP